MPVLQRAEAGHFGLGHGLALLEDSGVSWRRGLRPGEVKPAQWGCQMPGSGLLILNPCAAVS